MAKITAMSAELMNLPVQDNSPTTLDPRETTKPAKKAAKPKHPIEPMQIRGPADVLEQIKIDALKAKKTNGEFLIECYLAFKHK